MNSLEHEAAIFGGELAIFVERRKIPRRLFDNLDHLAFRAANIKIFGGVIRRQVAPNAREMACIEKDWKFIAAARLKGRVALYDVGWSEWVSIEEEKKKLADGLALQYAAFYHDSLDAARYLLHRGGVDSVILDDDEGASVSSVFSSSGLELRFTNTSLADITKEKIESGKAIEVDLSLSRQHIEFIDKPQ